MGAAAPYWFTLFSKSRFFQCKRHIFRCAHLGWMRTAFQNFLISHCIAACHLCTLQARNIARCTRVCTAEHATNILTASDHLVIRFTSATALLLISAKTVKCEPRVGRNGNGDNSFDHVGLRQDVCRWFDVVSVTHAADSIWVATKIILRRNPLFVDCLCARALRGNITRIHFIDLSSNSYTHLATHFWQSMMMRTMIMLMTKSNS